MAAIQRVTEYDRSAGRGALSGPAAEDSIARYLNEIGRHALLTPQGERDLAERIRAGRAAAELLATEASPVDQRRLRKVVIDGDRATEEFVQANLRLVVSVAKRYRSSGVPLLDLIQEGNLGLLRAVEKFDHTKGFRFSTYAMWWIRQFVVRGIAGSRSAVRRPTRANDELVRLRDLISTFEQASGTTPSIAELAEASGVPADRVRDLLATSDVVSLNASAGEDGTGQLLDFVADPMRQAEVEAPGDCLSPTELDRLLEALEPREREIVRRRFGFDDGEPQSIGAIATALGLSRERIRQLEHRAVSKLVHPSSRTIDALRGF